MDLWSCGTLACIGGHMSRFLGVERACNEDSAIAEYCGMGDPKSHIFLDRNHPLFNLFFVYEMKDRSVPGAVKRINAFIKKYGQEPYPIVQEEPDNEQELVGVT
jgi:hypothetical protein